MTSLEKGAHYYGQIVAALTEAERQGPFVWQRCPGIGVMNVLRVTGRVITCSPDVRSAVMTWERFSGIAEQ